MADKKKEKVTEEEKETKKTPETDADTDETVNTAETGETGASAEEATKPDKAKEWEDKYLRLYAEFDNFQKRSLREKDARYADAIIDFAGAMLDVLDNLQRALQTEVSDEEAKKMYEGVALVEKQMKDALTKYDIKEIKAVGEQFDPNVHNAVMHIEDEAIDDNTVVEEFMKGYIYKDSRVVRHSMVKVAN